MGILYSQGYIIWTQWHCGNSWMHKISSCVSTKWENSQTDLCCECLFCFDCVFSVIPHSSWRTALRAQLPCDRIPFLCPPVGSGHWRDAVWTERDGHLRGWDVSGRRDESLIHMCTWMSLAARSVIIYSHFSESDYLTRESFGSRTTHRRTKFAMYIGQRFLFFV